MDATAKYWPGQSVTSSPGSISLCLAPSATRAGVVNLWHMYYRWHRQPLCVACGTSGREHTA